MINFKEQLEQLVEPLARQFAAEKMNLQKDPLGEKLPEVLWRQTLPQARKVLTWE